MKNFIPIYLAIVLINCSFSIKAQQKLIPVIAMVDCTEIECFKELLSEDFQYYDSTHTQYQIQYNFYPQSEFIDGELKESPENRLTFGLMKDNSASLVRLNTEHKTLFDSTVATLLKQAYKKTSSTDFEYLVEEIYSSKDDIYLTVSTRVYQDLTLGDDLKFNVSLMRLY
ncbi:MAG: hypothetical protein AB8H47_29455 [Bacteroidia bacterium]